MGINEYRFRTRWAVDASPEEVFDVLTDLERLTRWWPSVYRGVEEVEEVGGHNGEGKRVRFHTQGWLPYRLRWELTVVRHQPPSLLAFRASGDLVGSGLWLLRDGEHGTVVEHRWHVRAERPLLRYGSPVLRPVFVLNHRWAMARGRESLELELDRRRGEAVAAPRGPVSLARSSALLLAAIGTVALAVLAAVRSVIVGS